MVSNLAKKVVVKMPFTLHFFVIKMEDADVQPTAKTDGRTRFRAPKTRLFNSRKKCPPEMPVFEADGEIIAVFHPVTERPIAAVVVEIVCKILVDNGLLSSCGMRKKKGDEKGEGCFFHKKGRFQCCFHHKNNERQPDFAALSILKNLTEPQIHRTIKSATQRPNLPYGGCKSLYGATHGFCRSTDFSLEKAKKPASPWHFPMPELFTPPKGKLAL